MNIDNILDGLDLDNSNMKLPDPSLLMTYKNLHERVIWLDDTVDYNAIEIIRQIIDWNRQDKGLPVEKRRPIKLMIYSYGGDGAACFSLVDVILASKTPVYTYNMGVAMSAGLIILLAGAKRFCTKHSTALIHSGSGQVGGTYDQTKAQMDDYDHFVEIMKQHVLERTSIDPKLLSKHKNKEWYIYADEQVSLGIVNEVIESPEVLL